LCCGYFFKESLMFIPGLAWTTILLLMPPHPP
jgi:hypothetical protein